MMTDVLNETYDFVFSIGENCATAMYLKSCCLRDASYPFDWLAGMPIPKRIELILSGFSRFMEKEDFVQESFYPFGMDRETGTPETTYRNTYTDLLFVHDFKEPIPFDEAYPKVKEKYERRINRLLKKLQDSQRILLVGRQWHSTFDVQAIVEAHEKLVRAYPGKIINILILQNDMTKRHAEYIPVSEHALLVKHALHGKRFKGNIPNNMEIFTRIKMPNLFWRRLRHRVLQKIIRVLATLHYPFSHKKRHQFMDEKKKAWLRE